MIKKLTLWLRKDGRKGTPDHFIKDVQDHDDPYHKDRFYGRTVCEDDKFETGVFMTLDDIQKIYSKGFSDGKEYMEQISDGGFAIGEESESAVKDYLSSVGVDITEGK